MTDEPQTAPQAPIEELRPPPREMLGLDEVIEQWHFEHFNSTALGNHTELWNLVLAAKDDLKRRLTELMKGNDNV